MARNVLAAVAGLVVGSVAVFVAETAGHFLLPLPPGVDPLKPETGRIPIANMAAVLVGWAIGALAAGFVATWIAKVKRYAPGLAAGWLLSMATGAMLAMIPSPVWFGMIGVGLYLPMSALGVWLVKRRYLAAAAMASWLMVIGGLADSATAAESRPNFVIVIADDMAWDDCGAYGHPRIRTPNIDRLAAGGMRFDAAFLATSSCSPSRCSTLTGRYPHNTGAAELHMPLPAEQILFTTPLRKAGYHTAAAGKWHLGPAAKSQFDKVLEGGGPSGCENWLTVLRERPMDKPFFLWLAAFDPHRDYAKNAIPQPHTRDDARVPPFLPDMPETRNDLAMYYDEIARLDGFLGGVLDELERQGVAEDTFVLFMTDNGRPFPRCKTTVLDSGVKTPFIVRWPKRIKAGSTNANLVASIDIAPTILELAGVEIGPTFQGRSFTTMLGDPTKKIREHVFAEHNWHDYQAHERLVRSERFAYVRNAFPQLPRTPPADAVRSPTFQNMIRLYDADKEKLPPEQQACFLAPRPAEELYDVVADPHQLKNLAEQPEHGETLAAMRAALDEWIVQTGDRIPERPTPDKYDRRTGKLPAAKKKKS